MDAFSAMAFSFHNEGEALVTKCINFSSFPAMECIAFCDSDWLAAGHRNSFKLLVRHAVDSEMIVWEMFR